MRSDNLIKWSYLFLLIASVLGVVLRGSFVVDTGVNYQFLLHAHSHVMLLGWLFNGFLWLITNLYQELQSNKYWKWGVLVLQISILGMLVAFPIQGYALYSIFFSTLHIVVSVFLMVVFFRTTRLKKGSSHLLLQWGWVFMLVSGAGPLALGPIIAMDMAKSDLYYCAIYFYLHFLYNGCFTFFALGVGVHSTIGTTEGNQLKKSIALLVVATILGAALSFLWAYGSVLMYAAGGVAVVLQVVAYYLIFKKFKVQLLSNIKHLKDNLLLVTILVAIVLKIAVQSIGALPWVVKMQVEAHPITIAYLHLVFLGVFTLYLVYESQRMLKVNFSRWSKLSFIFLLVATELLLVVPFILAYYFQIAFSYYGLLFYASIGFPIVFVWWFYKVVLKS